MRVSEPATLHFTCGKMAAGKTTLARRLAAELGAVLVSWDIWLQRLYPDEIAGFDDFLKYSARLRAAMGPHISDLLARGQDVVLDYPANVPASRAWVRSVFESAGARHVLHLVDTPDEQCLAQLAQRNRELPEGSVHMSADQFAAITALFVPPDPSEGFTMQVHGVPGA
ncbi:ATP-binding protein [Burkholderiaceae bacterium FT117]|uniref:AAA family ATPase n=1 Tax=Zeimonas sediminis TaxID=2944268 RepID=UPI002342C13B|nr:ATP-binding protein [Zeimonas sediminis]MCM5571242.1 ATP-binding protein [Zeimonas sediminis]